MIGRGRSGCQESLALCPLVHLSCGSCLCFGLWGGLAASFAKAARVQVQGSFWRLFHLAVACVFSAGTVSVVPLRVSQATRSTARVGYGSALDGWFQLLSDERRGKTVVLRDVQRLLVVERCLSGLCPSHVRGRVVRIERVSRSRAGNKRIMFVCKAAVVLFPRDRSASAVLLLLSAQ